jgi:nitrite reductase/ring-hydroxylating ferredoxin subunit/uncharacterized membrane protein
VSFPIAFYTGTFVFDAITLASDHADFDHIALFLNIAAVLTAVAAAVPGIIDYKYTVPPESSAKKRATKHALLNTSALVIFAVVLYLRHDNDPPLWLIAGLEVVALAAMFTAGWMGGTLVHRNQIGIDIRYADAGKWKEKYVNVGEGPIEVAQADELKLNQMQLIHVDGKRIAIGKTEAGYVAFDDRCCHKGGSLAAGVMICETVQCPWHGSQFNVRTGDVLAGPAKDNIKTYQVTEKEGKLFLQL